MDVFKEDMKLIGGGAEDAEDGVTVILGWPLRGLVESRRRLRPKSGILLSQTHLWSRGNTQCLLFFHPESVWKKVIFQASHHAKIFIHKTPNVYQINLRSLNLKEISKQCEFILPYWLCLVLSATDKVRTPDFGLESVPESPIRTAEGLSTDCQTKPMTGNHRTVQKHLSGSKKSLWDRWKGSKTELDK